MTLLTRNPPITATIAAALCAIVANSQLGSVKVSPLPGSGLVALILEVDAKWMAVRLGTALG